MIGLAGTRLRRLEWGGWLAVGAAGASLVVGLLVVTIVGFLVMLYSIGYMHHDRGLPRYYAELSLFIAAMNGLVLSDNLLEFFLFWELVGVCSYFLIGFYYERPAAASAAKEAFIVTRVGDVLFLLGIFIYFAVYATAGPGLGWAASGFRFVQGNSPFLASVMGGNTPLLTVAGLMMLAGAAGKSAQFPLDVWLPDAMEGPTTVSALIHAATMVAAGVYLLAVASLFLGFTSVDLLAIVAIGGFTTLWAASMAVVQPDIKRVIAYSTVSQLGYMVLAIGAGVTMVGLYHLFTHAFFKALLFLAAGSVIHAVGTQDLFKLGGLRKAMPLTSLVFLIGALALSGIPPFAGFWSKDDILSSVYAATAAHPEYWPFLLMAFAAVFLTAYYIFRAWFLTFSGTDRRDPTLPEAHEGPWVMQVPLVILASLAVVAGLFVFLPGFPNLLMGAGIPPTFSATDLAISGVSLGLAVGGIGTAWYLWGDGRVFVLAPDSAAQPVRTVLLERYYVKRAYDAFAQQGVYYVARLADFVDQFVIDGTVRGFERAFAALSQRLRRMQSGVVSDYAAYVIVGLVAVFVLLLFVGPYLISTFGGG